MTVAASIVINYGDATESGALVVPELDEVMNVDSAGEVKTEFYPGDQVWFLVHHDNTVRITSVMETDGSVESTGMVERVRSQQMFFKSLTDEQEISHVPIGSVSASWYGRSATLSQDGRKLTASAIPCIGEISYSMAAHQYCLTPPDLDLAAEGKYYIGVVINMESV